MDPLQLVSEWLDDAAALDLRVPHAAVLSTVGLDGYPNARTVAVKEANPDGVVVTGPLGSRKGAELASAPRCALTIWWDGLGRQIRVQGDARKLPSERARAHFAQRSREARVIATVSEQGALRRPGELESAYEQAVADPAEPPMPDSWGGWIIAPIRVEFMEFSDARFHSRTLFERSGGRWKGIALQP